MREICVNLEALSICKPKYASKMLWQCHIFDMLLAYPNLQTAYLANALVNFCSLSYLFYKMDILLEYQNGKFKRFWADRNSLL